MITTLRIQQQRSIQTTRLSEASSLIEFYEEPSPFLFSDPYSYEESYSSSASDNSDENIQFERRQPAETSINYSAEELSEISTSSSSSIITASIKNTRDFQQRSLNHKSASTRSLCLNDSDSSSSSTSSSLTDPMDVLHSQSKRLIQPTLMFRKPSSRNTTLVKQRFHHDIHTQGRLFPRLRLHRRTLTPSELQSYREQKMMRSFLIYFDPSRTSFANTFLSFAKHLGLNDIDFSIVRKYSSSSTHHNISQAISLMTAFLSRLRMSSPSIQFSSHSRVLPVSQMLPITYFIPTLHYVFQNPATTASFRRLQHRIVRIFLTAEDALNNRYNITQEKEIKHLSTNNNPRFKTSLTAPPFGDFSEESITSSFVKPDNTNNDKHRHYLEWKLQHFKRKQFLSEGYEDTGYENLPTIYEVFPGLPDSSVLYSSLRYRMASQALDGYEVTSVAVHPFMPDLVLVGVLHSDTGQAAVFVLFKLPSPG